MERSLREQNETCIGHRHSTPVPAHTVPDPRRVRDFYFSILGKAPGPCARCKGPILSAAALASSLCVYVLVDVGRWVGRCMLSASALSSSPSPSGADVSTVRSSAPVRLESGRVKVSMQHLDCSYSILIYSTPERGCAKRLAVHVIHRQAADSEDE